MTTEQRFKELLDIAVTNGYVHDKMTIDIEKELNNLVLNTNFFECLFKFTAYSTMESESIMFRIFNDEKHNAFSDAENTTKMQLLKFKWVLEVEKGTALEWLFKQFGI
jgi:hypothetical protein